MRCKPNNGDIAKKFDAAAATFDEESNRYTLRRRAEALAALTRGVSLELGGGTGAVTAALVDRSRAIHSDISPQMCRAARRRLGRPGICLDAEAVPLRDGAVDTVIASEVIYYLDRPGRLVAESFRILRPGGRLLISATNPVWQWADHTRSFLRRLGFRRTFFDDGSPAFLPPDRIIHLLKEAGFEPEECRRIVLAPIGRLDRLNRRLEDGVFSRLALFVIVVGRKPGALSSDDSSR